MLTFRVGSQTNQNAKRSVSSHSRKTGRFSSGSARSVKISRKKSRQTAHNINSTATNEGAAAAAAALAAESAAKAAAAALASVLTWCWVRVHADGRREASFRGVNADLTDLLSFQRELHPDEFATVCLEERIDGLRILRKEKQTVISHFFDTTITKTENLKEGSVEVVIQCPGYADVRILQKPFDWRRVDQQITVERLVDGKTPFVTKNQVNLGNQGTDPIVDVNHASGATFSFVGATGFFVPVAQIGVDPALDRRFFFDGSSPKLFQHVDSQGNSFTVFPDGNVKRAKGKPAMIKSCVVEENLNKLQGEKMRELLEHDLHKHCLPWRCLLQDLKMPLKQQQSQEERESTLGWTESLTSGSWRSQSCDGVDDPLGKMLLYGHDPKLFFVKDEDAFEAVFKAEFERVVDELSIQEARHPKISTRGVKTEGTDLEGLLTMDPFHYNGDVVSAMDWDPFSWHERIDLDKEFGYRLQNRKDLLSGDLKRMYRDAAYDYIQRNIAPETYKIEFYIDNDPSFPPSPLDDEGNTRPSFGQPKARCTCYTQSEDGVSSSASHCWMCCPDPAQLRMNYWDQDLKKLVRETKAFLNLESEALWDIYKTPYQIQMDEDRWCRNIVKMREATLEEWRRLTRPDADFGGYFHSDWKPSHLKESYLKKQFELEIKNLAKDIVAEVLDKSVDMLENPIIDDDDGSSSPTMKRTQFLTDETLKGRMRDSMSRKRSGSMLVDVQSPASFSISDSMVKFGTRNSEHSAVIHPHDIRELPNDTKFNHRDSNETAGERFEVFPNVIVINARPKYTERIVISLTNFTNSSARVTYALPFHDELVIGNHGKLRVSPPKKFFLSPGMLTTMELQYESQNAELPAVGDLGIIKRQIFIKFQPVQGFMKDNDTFYGYMLYVKIARKNTPKMMREASSVSVGYAIKMRQIQDEEDEEDDDDYRQRLRRRWEQCPITKRSTEPPSCSSSLKKWKSEQKRSADSKK